VDQARDPGPRGSEIGAEARRRSPHPEKRFLDRVLGQDAVAEDAEGKAVRRARVAVVELAEGALVAGSDAGEQLLVGRAVSSCNCRERLCLAKSRDTEDDGPSDALVEAPSLRSQVYERLREDILTGRLAAGERISPAETARRFGVSQMPVRDALALLEQDGLVETAARRWTRVVTLSPELVEELLPLVAVLEQFAVSSAPSIPAEALDRMRAANEQMQEAIEAGDATSYIGADAIFHDTLVEIAPNHSLERALREARTQIRLLRPQVLKPDDGVASLVDHRKIIECLERGDQEAAATAVAENWTRGIELTRSSRS
jgi:DNA-binding GntR family transcriptional regulator